MIQGCTPRGMLDGRENMQQRQEKKQKTEQASDHAAYVMYM